MRLTSVRSLVAGLVLAACGTAQAATMFGFDSSIQLNVRNDGNWMLGDKFTVNSADIVVSALGVQGVIPAGAPTFGLANGAIFSEPLQVGLWTAAGAFVTSAGVMQNDPVGSDGYVYHTLTTPVTLTAGSEYIIAAHLGEGIGYFADSGAWGYAFTNGDSAITVNQSLYKDITSGSFSVPNTVWQTANPRINMAPANAQFTVVPEPTSIGLLTLAGATMLCRRRPQR